MNEYFMNIALSEAKKSLKHDDVPVGAIIIKDGIVIAKAHNQKESKQMATKHAEIIVLEKASKKLKTWRLENCTMYVTMEPCMMCAGAIIQSRIKKVVYATTNEKFGSVESINNIFENNKNNHIVEIEKNILKEQASELLINFFKTKRK